MKLEPDTDEHMMLERIAKHVCERVRGTGAQAIVGGSFAKGTWLAGTRDIDIFARFDVHDEAELETRIPALFEAFPDADIVRGSREYLRTTIEGVAVEIIPIRPLSQTANTMDHSPDHITYVQDHLTNHRDVRALKALLKANRIYGAESHTRGFSGYVCELLIIAHGSLENLARAASTWERGARVHFHDGPSAFEDTLIVEDPTDENRNAAAAVDERSLTTFVSLMKRLENGETLEHLMEPRELEAPYLRITMHATHEKPDIGFAKLRTIHERLERELEPFGVRASEWIAHEDRWESRFSLDREELDTHTTRIGPPTEFEDAARAFREHHPDAYEHEGRLKARIGRDEVHWRDTVDRVCSHECVASYEAEVIR